MQKEKQLNNLQVSRQNTESGSGDFTKLFNYPSVGELFSENDTRQLDEFCSKISLTRENLERIVRYGNHHEADRAGRALRGIEVTLDFLLNLQKMRLNSKK